MPFEIIEHTADVGVECRAETIEALFEQAALGVLEINGAYEKGTGEKTIIELDAPDHGALLVDWLSEILYLHDARDAVVAGLGVDEIQDGRLRGWVELRERTGELVGTAVKAVTYHRLMVEQQNDEWQARFYVDV